MASAVDIPTAAPNACTHTANDAAASNTPAILPGRDRGRDNRQWQCGEVA
jgi:hypothetical protein